MRARAALLGVLLASGCPDKGDRFAPIVVDIAANCADAEVQVLLAEMEEGNRPWTRVLAAAVDAPGIDRYWALVEVDDAPGSPGVPTLALQYIDGTIIGARHVLYGIDPTLPETSLELRPGPIPGTAWLLQRGPGTFLLWQVDASFGAEFDPLVAQSIQLGSFPEASALLCDTGYGELGECDVRDWTRELVFLDGRAFVAGIPPFSPDNTTYVYLGPLDSGLNLGNPTPLVFDRMCDPTEPLPEYTACTEENAATTYPEIAVMGSQRSTNATEHRMFVLRQRMIGDTVQPREIVFLKLFLDGGNQPAGTIQSKALEDVEPLVGAPSGISRDDFASYMMHRVRDDASGGIGPPVVTRLSELEDEFDVLQGITLTDDVSLLQLESDIALARIIDGEWEVTKLFPDAPEQSEVSTYAASAAIVRTSPAGHGSFLLFKDARGPDLVHVACEDEASADTD